VAIMATGSELVPHDQVPGGAKIRNSNAPAIAACVREAGGVADVLPIVRDTYEELRCAVKAAVADHDMVVTTGGAANGDYDFIKQVVSDLGRTHVTLVNMRPGKAETFGTVDGVPVFGLPGNPAAAYIGFQMLVRPALRKMQGYSHFERMRVKARLGCDMRAKKDPRMTLVRAVMTRADDGSFTVAPLDKQSSGLFGPLQKSNALIVCEHGDEGHAAGAQIECLLLDIDEECVL
jgi:molybdopterin molybdotransferase